MVKMHIRTLLATSIGRRHFNALSLSIVYELGTLVITTKGFYSEIGNNILQQYCGYLPPPYLLQYLLVPPINTILLQYLLQYIAIQYIVPYLCSIHEVVSKDMNEHAHNDGRANSRQDGHTSFYFHFQQKLLS